MHEFERNQKIIDYSNSENLNCDDVINVNTEILVALSRLGVLDERS